MNYIFIASALSYLNGMKRFLFVLIFLTLHFCVSAQQFSQYNTGTLYDAFENPAQKAFIPDSSRKVAFNLFFPNFNTDVTLAGNVQAALKNRAFLGHYEDNALTIGKQNFNYANANINAYSFMLKVYNSLNGDQELGFFAQSRFEGRGVFSDESVQLVADNTAFSQASYSDLFNNRFNYQAYHQIGVSYRGNVDEHLAFGVKVSALLGVVMNKVDINRSIINFDRAKDRAFLSMEGNYYASFDPGKFSIHDLLPSTKNPGASISFGTLYIADDKTRIQLNIKDLGFIHWNSLSHTGHFNNTGIIDSLSFPGIENRMARTASSLVQSNPVEHGFTTPTNSKAEVSASKAYLLNSYIKYTPTVILSKELFYTGFTAAMVNHFQYHNLVGTLTGAYSDMHFFSIGTQLMIKSPNAEFFIGTDRLVQSLSLARSTNTTSSQISKNSTFSGANFFMGFSIKMGAVIEHPYNASSIPMGDHRNFVKRFWQRITKKED
ncbi:hypothetical protein GCM10028826_22730 [Mucilaginibacter boryungensis]